MTAPGWYPDPDDPTARRYFDGATWSSALRTDQPAAPAPRAPSRPRFIKWIVLALFLVGAGLFLFLPIHKSLFGTTVSCGNALHARTIDPDYVKTVVERYEIDNVVNNPDASESDDPTYPMIAQAASDTASDCKSDGNTHVVWAVALGLVGVALAGGVWAWEVPSK